MKIKIYIDEKATDITISVTCSQLTSDVEKVLAALKIIKHQLTVKKDNEIYLLDIRKIIYI